MVLVVCTSSDDALYFYEVSRKYLEQFSRLGDGRADRWTDRQLRQKQYVSTPVRGRHNFQNPRIHGSKDVRGLKSITYGWADGRKDGQAKSNMPELLLSCRHKNDHEKQAKVIK